MHDATIKGTACARGPAAKACVAIFCYRSAKDTRTTIESDEWMIMAWSPWPVP